jgi:hypothetical protein
MAGISLEIVFILKYIGFLRGLPGFSDMNIGNGGNMQTGFCFYCCVTHAETLLLKRYN